MNATSCTTQDCAPSCDSVSTSEIDASCHLPVLAFFSSGAFWLIVASVLGFLASLKFHAANLFSDCAWLGYGRLHAAASTAFLYGFAIQAGWGVSLWILARLGQNKVTRSLLITFGGKLWNIGVFLGVIGILAGSSTGFDLLEMPRYSSMWLFIASVLIGLGCLTTMHHRRVSALEPSQWFLVAALFWFPWIFSTARLLLVARPVRGVTQSIIAWWYAANLSQVWLTLVGLAAVFYFIPLLMNRTLHSRALALFTFWTLIFFASWTGIPASAPLPAWMPALSAIASLMTILPVVALVLNVYRTVGYGCSQTENPPPGKFIAFGAMAFVIAWTMNIVGAIPPVSAVLNLTWYTVAQAHLNSYGFFSMIMFGAIYYIVPLVTGTEWPRAKMVRAHFWLAAIGTILLVASLAVGGIIQGIKLSHPQIAFNEVTKATLPFLRASTTGELLIALGHVIFAANLAGLLTQFARTKCAPLLTAATIKLNPAEVKL